MERDLILFRIGTHTIFMYLPGFNIYKTLEQKNQNSFRNSQKELTSFSSGNPHW